MNIKMIIAYKGSRYLGWQKTPMGPSIEETLHTALETVLRAPISLQAASRTDAGVHAHGQVVNFFCAGHLPPSFHKSVNALLPDDIRVLSLSIAKDTFHPTLGCSAKEYHYQICNTPHQSPFHRETSWHVPLPLSSEKMQCAAQHLLGTHDFSTFCNDRAIPKRGGICRLDAITLQPLEGSRYNFSVIGNCFLYKMVRNLVGTLVHVGHSKIAADALPAILASKKRSCAGITAPAHGLTLKRVLYDDATQ